MKFALGVDYYPEHWSKELWDGDVKLMANAKFNIVRLAEFAWSRIESQPGKYDFKWLDESIEGFRKRNVNVILGTPTAAPPAWLVEMRPDILPVDENGHRFKFGRRRHYCPNNLTYLEHVSKIVTIMAKHYKDNPAVFGWQVDNELSWPLNEVCYCIHCKREFREWLKKRYGSLERLNERYGTVFWSQEYSNWEQIEPPSLPLRKENPGLALDWLRFKSDSWIRFLKFQIGMLRREAPGRKITTNLMGLFPQIDHYKLSEPLDFVSWDCYPAFKLYPQEPVETAMLNDATRCFKKDRGFWLMELQSGPTVGIGRTLSPGEIRKLTYQCIAHGADGIVYFRWRTYHKGSEQFWHGILNHDNRINRRYTEVKEIGNELERIGDLILDTKFVAKAAVIFSYDSLRATSIEGDSYGVDYYHRVLESYRGLWRNRIQADVISPNQDFSTYSLILLPFGYVVDQEFADKLKNFVKNGGTLIAEARTGVKDANNGVYTEPLPGPLRDLFGMTVGDYDIVENKFERKIFVGNDSPIMAGKSVKVKGWVEWLEPEKAEVLGVHGEGWMEGKPAITLNKFGRGQAIYIGTFMGEAMAQLIHDVIPHTSLTKVATVRGDGTTEVVKRSSNDSHLLFVINHDWKAKSIEVILDKPCSIEDLIEREINTKSDKFKLELKPNGVKVLFCK